MFTIYNGTAGTGQSVTVQKFAGDRINGYSDVSLVGPDETKEARAIYNLVAKELTDPFYTFPEDVLKYDANSLQTAIGIVEMLTDKDKLSTNRRRRFYLCCVIDHFHDVAIRASMDFSRNLELAATMDAKEDLSDQEMVQWLNDLDYESVDSEHNLHSYSMTQRVMLELHRMGLTYLRPNWLYGLPDAIQYGHVDYFGEMGCNVFANLWTRFQLKHDSEAIANSLWVDLALAAKDGVTGEPWVTATLLTEKVPVNMQFVFASSRRLLAEVLCYSEQDSLDTVLDAPPLWGETADIIQRAQTIYEDSSIYREWEVCIQDEHIACTAKKILERLDPVHKCFSTNRDRRFYLCTILKSFRDAAVDAYEVYSGALKRAAELDLREWPELELETWIADLNATNNNLTKRVNRYQLAHRVLLELHNFDFLYKRPNWLVGLPESLVYGHAAYFGIATRARGTYINLWRNFKQMDPPAIDEYLWSDAEDVMTMTHMLERS
eukprot:gene27715-34212_t